MFDVQCGILLFLCLCASAADVDIAKLPPSAPIQIDFARDIQPIFESSCFRCHGPEKPRSKFRLDNRESALKGGENGVDIIPGNSAQSPLIHYVAWLVSGMEMPRKGEPLTSEQISLLRAWIDQGAKWSTSAPPMRMTFSVSPTVRWITVSGDKRKFREVENMREGFSAGLEEFSLREQISPDTVFSADGRMLFPDEDFKLSLALRKTDLGFVHAGVEKWRKYYDDTGGFYRPFTPSSFDLQRDLHLDIGRAWIDFGLTLPDWPQMVLGYEYQFKEGDKSMLQWGPVSGKNIYPSAKKIDEHTHILKFDLTHEFHEWQIEDNARVEFSDSKTRRDDANTFSFGPGPDSFVRTEQGFSHVQGMNTLHIERQITDWLFLGSGYFYSKFDGDASFDQISENNAGALSAGSFWFADDLTLKRESHIISANTLLRPIENLSISGGVQSEWSEQNGLGHIHLDEGDPNQPAFFLLRPATVRSDLDRQKISENAAIRFTQIPFTVLFAETRFEQENISQFEQDIGTLSDSFLRDTDAANRSRDWRFGFNTSPWQKISLSAHFRNRVSDTDYDHLRDAAIVSEGYSAFIRARKIDTDEIQTKLVFRPFTQLKTTLTYQLVGTEYHTRTDPVSRDISPGRRIFAGNYDADIYGINATLTPIPRLYLSGTFTYSRTRTVTADHGNPSVVPYRGDVYTLISSATFAWNKTTDLNAAYSYTRADYGQNNFVDGLPLGLSFVRHGLLCGIRKQLTANLETNLRYGFFRYDEPQHGSVNGYTAHGVFATVTMKWR